jgi:hypothetical protein
MKRKLTPPEPPPRYGGRRTRADGILDAGSRRQATDRLPLAPPAAPPLGHPGGGTNGISACPGPRAPPAGHVQGDKNRADGWLHRP